jgi:hypothetical protein
LAERVAAFRLPGADEAPFDLRISPAPGAVARPLVRSMARAPIADLFDRAGGALLILGAEGSGKTTILLRLARVLLERGLDKVPVVVDLASWGEAGGDLQEWLVHELYSHYLVPKPQFRLWLRERRLVLLLDGLDEVKESRRRDCVVALNRFLADVGAAGVAVCTRPKEYLAQPERLELAAAVQLEPLSAEQIASYLRADGADREALAEALAQDPVLGDLATSPLLLGVMTAAYEDGRPAVGSSTAADARTHVLERYVDRMFARRAGEREPYEKRQALAWLQHLASSMLQHGQPELIVEQIQPSWLATGTERAAYVLLTRVIVGVVIGACEGLYLFAFASDGLGLWTRGGSKSNLLWAGVAAGALFGAGVAVVDGLRLKAGRLRGDAPEAWWRTALILAAYWLLFVAVLASVGINARWRAPFGLVWALLFALRGRWQGPSSDVRPVLELAWSWRRAARGTAWGALAGVGITVCGGMAIPSFEHELSRNSDWAVASATVLMYAAAGFAIGGATPAIGETKRMHGSGRAGFPWASRGLFTLAAMFVFTLVLYLVEGVVWFALDPAGLSELAGTEVTLGSVLARALAWGVATGVVAGTYTGVLGALWFAGADAIQHTVLRWLLWRRGRIPWRLSRFLGWCTRLVLLKRAGHGYRFMHGAFAEHFARGTDAPR